MHLTFGLALVAFVPSECLAAGACDTSIHTWIDTLEPHDLNGPYPVRHSDVGEFDISDFYLLGAAQIAGALENDSSFDAEILAANENMLSCLADHTKESLDPTEMDAMVRKFEEDYPLQARLDLIHSSRKN